MNRAGLEREDRGGQCDAGKRTNAERHDNPCSGGRDATRDCRASATSRACRSCRPPAERHATPFSAGRSPRLRLRRAFHRERGEWIVGSQYPCSKRNIGTML
ncbi:hypothetical protein DF044_26760 [Burkholderia contaminans]|nr:hypothetical protein DF044_26760 [Burkholderia contaminans]